LPSSIPGRGAARAKELLPGAENIFKPVVKIMFLQQKKTYEATAKN
jgi:hypothetical protein